VWRCERERNRQRPKREEARRRQQARKREVIGHPPMSSQLRFFLSFQYTISSKRMRTRGFTCTFFFPAFVRTHRRVPLESHNFPPLSLFSPHSLYGLLVTELRRGVLSNDLNASRF
jgi:hypothetical protein